MKFKISELGPSVIRCMSEADRRALGIATPPAAAVSSNGPCAGGKSGEHPRLESPPRGLSRGKPNKTELEYRNIYLRGVPAAYEGLTFRMANGHRYTPDWVHFGQDGRLTCIECKGAYRFGSHQRARLAFDQARVEWPGVRWVWAVRQKGGAWKIEG